MVKDEFFVVNIFFYRIMGMKGVIFVFVIGVVVVYLLRYDWGNDEFVLFNVIYDYIICKIFYGVINNIEM